MLQFSGSYEKVYLYLAIPSTPQSCQRTGSEVCVKAVHDATSDGIAFVMAGVPAALSTAQAILRRGGLVVVAGRRRL